MVEQVEPALSFSIKQIIPQHLTDDFIIEVEFVYGIVNDKKKI